MCCVSVYVWVWNSRSFVAPLSITPYGGARSPAMHCLYFCRTHNNTMQMYSVSFSNRWTAFTSFNWKLCGKNIELHQSDWSLLRLGNDHYEYSDVFILFIIRHGDGGTAEPAQTHINLRLLEICLDLRRSLKVIYLACVLTAKHC